LGVGILSFATAVQTAKLPHNVNGASTGVDATLLEHDPHFIGQSSVVFGGVEPENSDMTRRGSPKAFADFNRAGFPGADWTKDSSDLSGIGRK
jgi:hypothetical protein